MVILDDNSVHVIRLTTREREVVIGALTIVWEATDGEDEDGPAIESALEKLGIVFRRKGEALDG